MLIGMGGLVSLAQAAFYGIGAYATAIGMTALGLGFFTTIILGIAINSVLAFVVGKILARFQGDYYAIVSAGLSIIVFSILQNWKSVTHGPQSSLPYSEHSPNRHFPSSYKFPYLPLPSCEEK